MGTGGIVVGRKDRLLGRENREAVDTSADVPRFKRLRVQVIIPRRFHCGRQQLVRAVRRLVVVILDQKDQISGDLPSAEHAKTQTYNMVWYKKS